MIWKFTGDKPVYQQIMLTIQGAVLRGEYTPGEKIPSVRDMAMAAKVNPNTMQHALQELERTGLLISCSTSGRHLTEDKAVIEQMRQNILDSMTKKVIAEYSALGISPAEASKMLLDYSKERNDP